MEIDKSYFTLPEILARWSIKDADLAYLAENAKLRLSIRVFGLPIEFGHHEEVDPGIFVAMPSEIRRFSGLLDLYPQDLYAIFRGQEVAPTDFQAPDAGYARLLDDHVPPLVRKGDLVIRQHERDRFEKEEAAGFGPGATSTGAFSASADYQHVEFKGQSFRFGPIQAAVVRALHEAALAGSPWQNGKSVLERAQSQSLRMSDVFKSKPNWRQLILSDGRGSYRLAQD